MARNRTRVKYVFVDGERMTEDQAKVYKCLKRQKKPKTPKEIGEKIGKSRKATWNILNGTLRNKDLIEKDNHHKPDYTKGIPPIDNTVKHKHYKGQGKYYIPGSCADPDYEDMKRMKERYEEEMSKKAQADGSSK